MTETAWAATTSTAAAEAAEAERLLAEERRRAVLDMCECDAQGLRPTRQEYALVSFVGTSPGHRAPDGTLAPFALKVIGCFGTQDEAVQFAQQVYAPAVPRGRLGDLYVLKAGAFEPLPPRVEMIADTRYQEKALQEIVDKYLNAEQRKRDAQAARVAMAAAQSVPASAPVISGLDRLVEQAIGAAGAAPAPSAPAPPS